MSSSKDCNFHLYVELYFEAKGEPWSSSDKFGELRASCSHVHCPLRIEDRAKIQARLLGVYHSPSYICILLQWVPLYISKKLKEKGKDRGLPH